jgi:hypothetical protein
MALRIRLIATLQSSSIGVAGEPSSLVKLDDYPVGDSGQLRKKPQ